MKKWLATSAVFLAAGASAQGLPLVDVEIGAGNATHNLNGGQLGSEVSLVDGDKGSKLNLGDSSGLYLKGSVGIPILPKIKFQYQPMVFESDKVEAKFSALGSDYTLEGGRVELDMTHLDTTLHYGLPDLLPGIDYFVDFGVNLRWLLGGFEAEVPGKTESYDFTAIPLPAGHLAAGGTIPGVGVELSGKLNTLPLDGLSYNDWELKARYNLPVIPVADIGVEAGYKSWTIDIDGSESVFVPENELKVNLETSGLFVGVAAGF